MRPNACTTLSSLAVAVAGILGLGGCDLDVPDLNNPALDEFVVEPTAAGVAYACTGLLIGTRTETASAIGYVSQLGILGRESYNFDPADPRNMTEMLGGRLSPASPFGGAFWAEPYSNIRLANITLSVLDEVPEFDEATRSAVRGYVHTIQAMDLLRVITTRDTVGAVIDADHPVDELGNMVSREDTYDDIALLLDDAAGELADGGGAFPFLLTSGFAGFDTPQMFIPFNRALRARLAAYQGDYDTVQSALDESFINDTADSVTELEVGVYHTYGIGTGDLTNGLINPNLFAHPRLETEAQRNGDTIDARFSRKVRIVDPGDEGGAQGVTSNLQFTMYRAATPVPIIRNEELILLRAEAAWGTGDLDAATADLNLIRTVSGELEPLPAGLSADEIEDEILYNRGYSLMFEGGHRWIDARRFAEKSDDPEARIMELLPLALDTHFINLRYPLPAEECDARGNEPACDVSTLGFDSQETP